MTPAHRWKYVSEDSRLLLVESPSLSWMYQLLATWQLEPAVPTGITKRNLRHGSRRFHVSGRLQARAAALNRMEANRATVAAGCPDKRGKRMDGLFPLMPGIERDGRKITHQK